MANGAAAHYRTQGREILAALIAHQGVCEAIGRLAEQMLPAGDGYLYDPKALRDVLVAIRAASIGG